MISLLHFGEELANFFKNIEPLLSSISSIVTIFAFFLIFRQWKKQVIANKKDTLSSKAIVLLKKIEYNINMLRNPFQLLPSGKKPSEQQAWYFEKWYNPLYNHMYEFESILIEYSLLCGNEILEKYHEGLRNDIKDLFIAFDKYIKYLESKEKVGRYKLYSPRQVTQIMKTIRGEDSAIEKRISSNISELTQILKGTLIQ